MSVQSSNEVQSMHRNAVSGEPEAEHRAVHRRLCEYARHRSALDAAEAFDLVRAEQFKLYALHGCATHLEYMERILGYGPHAARERMRVARALVRLPETTAALARGELSYSAARELTRVATDETETAWLARAQGLVVHQIERLVANHQLGDRPDDPPNPSLRPRIVRLELPPEVYALWRQARMVAGRGTRQRDQRRRLRRDDLPRLDRPGHRRERPGAPDRLSAVPRLPAHHTERRRTRHRHCARGVRARVVRCQGPGFARCNRCRARHHDRDPADPRAGVRARSPSLHGARMPLGTKSGDSPHHRAGQWRHPRVIESLSVV